MMEIIYTCLMGRAGSATDYSRKIERRKIFVLKTDGTVVNTIALDKNSNSIFWR